MTSSARDDARIARPFVKWAGGKRALAPIILDRMREIAPRFEGDYYEPFVGGGAVYFALRSMCGGRVRAYLSDANRRLVRTYLAVKDSHTQLATMLRRYQRYYDAAPRQVFDALRAMPIDSHVCELHEGGRVENIAVPRDRIDEETLDRWIVCTAAWLIALNKTCFNGLYRVNKSGKFNAPMGRYMRPVLCDESAIYLCHRALSLGHTTIVCGDFSVVTSHMPARAGDMVYFDPPYAPVKTSSFTSYDGSGFGEQEHKDLQSVALILKNRGVHVVMSNSDAPMVRDLYRAPEFDVREVRARRSVNSRGDGRGEVTELLIT